MARSFLFILLLFASVHAFSTTNLQYLYGDFEGPTFLDTQKGAKQTLTAEHCRTWQYGDLFMFADYTYAKEGLRFTDKKNDLYGEISPRISFNKLSSLPISNGIIKEWFAAAQYNRSDTYRAWLYGIGTDWNIPGFQIFSLNLYRKVHNIGHDTYQLSANYYAQLGHRWHFEGFSDWTTINFLTQNQLLFDLAPDIGVTRGKFEIGTEWHYYHQNNTDTDNDVFQAIVKYTF